MQDLISIENFQDTTINIFGTHQEPFFKFKEIYSLLNLKIPKLTPEYISELELYKVLFKNEKKTIVIEFQEWIRNVIKNLRHQDTIESIKQLQIQNDILKKSLKTKDQTEFKTKAYTQYKEIEKNENVYILSTDVPGVYKVGKTLNQVKKRVGQLQTNCVNDIKIIFTQKVNNAGIVESVVHYVLDGYRSTTNREHFKCNVDFIKKALKDVSKVIHVYSSCSDTIPLEDIYQYLKFDNLESNFKITPIVLNDIPSKDVTISNFISEKCTLQDGNKISCLELISAFQVWKTKNNITEITSVNEFNNRINSITGYNKDDKILLRNVSVRGWCGIGLK